MKRHLHTAFLLTALIAALLVPLGWQYLQQNTPSSANLLRISESLNDETHADVTAAEQPEPAATESEPRSAAEPRRVAFTSDGRECEDGVVLVGIPDGASANDINAQLASFSFFSQPQVSETDIETGHAKLALSSGTSVEDAVSQLNESGSVVTSQPNYVYHLQGNAQATSALKPSKPNLGLLGMSINDPYCNRLWGLDAIDAYDAWNSTKTSKAVSIAVVDSGIDVDHEDLRNNIVHKASFWAENPTANDWNGHGTQVAGIAAAEANNAKGVAGASYNAGIVAVQAVEQDASATTEECIWGLDYATKIAPDYNVRIINFSIGGPGSAGDKLMDAAITRAHNAGLLIVYAAGNAASSEDFYPVDFDSQGIGVMSVLDEDGSYSLSSFSNFNGASKTKQLCAPGEDIYSTSNDGSYDSIDGTSMAAPFVSGVAALLFTANPQLTAEEARTILCNNATDLGSPGWDDFYGYGLVNAQRSVAEALRLKSASATSIAGAKVSLSSTSFTYDGTAKEPDVTVKLNGVTLTKGVHYSVSYSSNVNAGKAKVTVTGKNGYQGEAQATFSIAKASIKKARLGLSLTSCIYNGKAKKPAVTVKNNGKTLAKKTDYKVTYLNNTNAGKATVKVTGTGNYQGSVSASFTIEKAKLQSLKLTEAAYSYIGKTRTPKAVVRGVKGGASNQVLTSGKDYKLTTPTGRVNAGVYTYQATGTGNYTGTVKAKLTIRKAKISSVRLSKASYRYNGKVRTPKVTVLGIKKGVPNSKLKLGTDYKLSVPKGRKAKGTYIYTVEGKGNYTGVKRTKLVIR